MISADLLSRVQAFEHEFNVSTGIDTITLHIKRAEVKLRWWERRRSETYTMTLRYARSNSREKGGDLIWHMNPRCAQFLDVLQNYLMYQEHKDVN